MTGIRRNILIRPRGGESEFNEKIEFSYTWKPLWSYKRNFFFFFLIVYTQSVSHWSGFTAVITNREYYFIFYSYDAYKKYLLRFVRKNVFPSTSPRTAITLCFYYHRPVWNIVFSAKYFDTNLLRTIARRDSNTDTFNSKIRYRRFLSV